MPSSNQILVGRPYALPFEESFKNAECQNYWGVRNSKMGAFMLSDLFSSDGDGGSVLFESGDNTGEAEILSGMIDVSEAEHLCLKSIVALNSGKVELTVESIRLTARSVRGGAYSLGTAGSVGKLEVNLDKYAGQDYVQLFFNAKGKTDGTMLFIDEIRLADEESAGVAGTLADAEAGPSEAMERSVSSPRGDGREGVQSRWRCVFAGKCKRHEDDSRRAGVYVVAVGETTFKVVVR